MPRSFFQKRLDWRSLDPDQLEERVVPNEGRVTLQVIENAASQGVTGLEEVLTQWEDLPTLPPQGITALSWRQFLMALRQARLDRARTRCYVMLDFDGVLHPLKANRDAYFVHLPAFEAVLRDYQGIEVIITSSWRHTRPFDELKRYFHPDLRDRVIGATPDIPPQPGQSDDGSREREIDRWIQDDGVPGVPWIALDDEARLFKPGAPVLITDSGFGDAEAQMLRDALDDPRDFARRCAHWIPAKFHQHDALTRKIYLEAIDIDPAFLDRQMMLAEHAIPRDVIERVASRLGTHFKEVFYGWLGAYWCREEGIARIDWREFLSDLKEARRMVQQDDFVPPDDGILVDSTYRHHSLATHHNPDELVVMRQGMERHKRALSWLAEYEEWEKKYKPEDDDMARKQPDDQLWRSLDPYELERLVQVNDGRITHEEIERVGSIVPGFELVFHDWGRYITVDESGIPERDWRAFLASLHRWYEQGN